MTVRRFTVALFQIFTKGLLIVLAEAGRARHQKRQGVQDEAEAAQHTGQSVARCPRAAVHLYDGRAVRAHPLAGSALQR